METPGEINPITRCFELHQHYLRIGLAGTHFTCDVFTRIEGIFNVKRAKLDSYRNVSRSVCRPYISSNIIHDHFNIKVTTTLTGTNGSRQHITYSQCERTDLHASY